MIIKFSHARTALKYGLLSLKIKPKDEILIPEYICDAVILPHIKISQSGIIPLAYEFNKLIIASGIPSFKENIEDGQTGYLFKNNNYISLKEKIEYIYNYPNSYKSNIEDYKQKYSKDNLISDFDKLLNI